VTKRIFLSLRKHRNYRLFFTGQVVSLAGTWMQNIALAWFVVELTHSPLAIGGLAFCRFLPFMVFGLWAGVVADRFDNRKLVMWTQGAQMAVSLALTVFVFAGLENLPAVYVLAFLGGTALVFDAPGRQSLTFQMVGRDELPNAVALNTGLFNGSRIIGPAIAGLIIAAGGVGICFAINTISFLAVLTALALMRRQDLYPVKRDERKRTAAAIREGLSYAWHTPEIRLALIILGISSTVGFNFHVILPVLTSQTLHAGPRAFGILSACFGAGALVGATVQAARGAASWRLLLMGATGFSTTLVLLALVTTVAFAGAVLFAAGICFTMWVSNTSAILQLRAPDRLRGRVMSLFMFAFAGLAPIGGLFAGLLMDLGGTPLALSIGGALSLAVVSFAWTRHYPVRSLRSALAPEAQEVSSAA
jgi:MFS family permease